MNPRVSVVSNEGDGATCCGSFFGTLSAASRTNDDEKVLECKESVCEKVYGSEGGRISSGDQRHFASCCIQ